MGFHISFTIFNPLLVLLLALCTFRCSKGCVETERVALLDFKTSFTSSSQNQGKLSSWNSSEECCHWEGITCDNHSKHVVSIDLPSQDLESYQLRPSLVELQHLWSLDLSLNNLNMRIPMFIGSLSKLTHLDLSYSGLFGTIPTQLGNLANLQFLDLKRNSQLSTNNFQWLSHLSSLNILDMSYVNFSEARDYLSAIINLPSLSEFSCVSCHFPTDPDMSSHVNSSSSLRDLDLSHNNLSSTVLSLLINSAKNLETLDISGNHLDDGVFNSIGNLCNLKELDASECTSKESLVNILQALSTCASRSLESLVLSSMNLTGTIPSMSKFQSLTTLYLSDNCLDSLPPPNGRFPANLGELYLDNNNLNGALLDVHFTNLSQLQVLYLSHNPNLTISFNKLSLFTPTVLHLRSCNLGPNFPSGLPALNSIVTLDISDCKISGTIPNMFWVNLSPSIDYLNLSSNSLHGVVPNIPFQFSSSFSSDSYVDLSSNAFSGPIPFFLFTATTLKLSNNLFSKFAPIPHPYSLSTDLPILTRLVDISNNHLQGLIPHWLGLPSLLHSLILANNNLSGTIPSSIGQAVQLYMLNLENNNLSGPLPSFLKKCSELRLLDLGGNHFSGFIPSWMGENLKNLSVLSLRSNSLMGILPTSLCHLSSLQILDISHNMLSGNIPSCIHDFSTMAHDTNSSLEVPNYEITVSYEYGGEVYYYNAYIKWKSKVWKFESTLHLVKLIDLSSNNLTGEIPTGLASLVKLDSIDLSCNNLQGSIPSQIGQLKSLQYLNLSYNRICGQIPQSLSETSALEMLNLSHNNLSGRIPKSTQLQSFDPSAFAGNPELCGLPLRKCPGDGGDLVQPPPTSPTDDGEMQGKRGDKESFYAGLGAGFACGFFGILGTLTCITTWRHAFFHFASEFGEWILLNLASSKSKISRKIGLK